MSARRDALPGARARATASAAASVANLGPGFDVLGLCLAGPRDEVTAERTDDGRVKLISIEGDDGRLPRQAEANCAGVAARAVLDRFAAAGVGVRLRLVKGLPFGSGLGGSAASAVAAAVATAAVAAPGVPREQLLDACRAGEELAAGSPHPDNVAPSLLGGLVACLRTGEAPPGGMAPIEVVRLPLPSGLHVACIKPSIEIRTVQARAVLPRVVPMADAIFNLASMAALVTALCRGDMALLGRAMGDRLATPYRAPLVPGFDDVVEAARRAGAIGAGLSGSGPTVFALAESLALAERAADAMSQVFRARGLDRLRFVGPVEPTGARLIEATGEA